MSENSVQPGDADTVYFDDSAMKMSRSKNATADDHPVLIVQIKIVVSTDMKDATAQISQRTQYLIGFSAVDEGQRLTPLIGDPHCLIAVGEAEVPEKNADWRGVRVYDIHSITYRVEPTMRIPKDNRIEFHSLLRPARLMLARAAAREKTL